MKVTEGGKCNRRGAEWDAERGRNENRKKRVTNNTGLAHGHRTTCTGCCMQFLTKFQILHVSNAESHRFRRGFGGGEPGLLTTKGTKTTKKRSGAESGPENPLRPESIPRIKSPQNHSPIPSHFVFFVSFVVISPDWFEHEGGMQAQFPRAVPRAPQGGALGCYRVAPSARKS